MWQDSCFELIKNRILSLHYLEVSLLCMNAVELFLKVLDERLDRCNLFFELWCSFYLFMLGEYCNILLSLLQVFDELPLLLHKLLFDLISIVL